MANDIARLGFVADTAALSDAKADLQALVPPAERAQKAANATGAALDEMASGAAASAAALDSAARGASAEAAAIDKVAASANNATNTVNNLAKGQAGVGAAIKTANDNLRDFDAHIIAYRSHLDNVSKSLRFSSTEALNFSRQLSDIGVTAAMGMSPLMIAIQQGPQLFDILQLKASQSGKTIGEVFKMAGVQVMEALAPILPYLVALTAFVAAAGIVWVTFSRKAVGAGTDLVDNLDEIDKALKAVDFSTGALSNAQSILAGYMDITTGKITNQSSALHDLALAQAMVAKVQAQVRQQQAKQQLEDMSAQKLMIGGGPMGLTVGTGFRPEAGIIDAFKSGGMTGKSALTQLQRLKDMGQLTNKAFLEAAQAVANFNVETENIKVYDNLQDAINGDKGALSGFLKPKKTPKARKGPKTDAEKFSDVVGTNERQISLLQAQAKGLDISANASLRMENQQKLLNEAQAKGITLTSDQAKVLKGLADRLTDAQIALANAKGFKDITDGLDKQLNGAKSASQFIGKYGEELDRMTIIQNAYNDALAKNIILTEQQRAAIEGRAATIAKQNQDNKSAQFLADATKQMEDMQFAMERERGEIGLSGAALETYRKETELLTAARKAGVDQDPAVIAGIHASAEAYGKMRDELNKQQEAFAFTRDAAKGFLTDMLGGLREGQTVWQAFGNAVLNVLNKIIDKLADKAFDALLDGIFGTGGNSGSSGGGLFGDIFGGIFGDRPGGVINNAKGNAFASGGIVNTPTMFKFGKGGAIGQMGEAGPEGILPLSRGPDGKLGVTNHGGASNDNSDRPIVIQVVGEEGAAFVPRVQAISEEKAVTVVQAGIAAYNDQMPERFQQIAGDERAR